MAAAITETTGLPATVRFPNDVLLEGQKVAGILAEASDGRVVLGIGVNANQTADELEEGATSLRARSGEPVDRPHLLAAILASLEREYDGWLTASGASG